ncbi:nicotinamide riboside transporter PnuC [Slackia heliotrinireducens]|uniref:nicotinamide riboside transporter PnuC n=1 Tax=Slackia heliotrinireducens TaxID=84110 RepID=UPI0033162CC9
MSSSVSMIQLDSRCDAQEKRPLRFAGFNPFELAMIGVVAAVSVYFFVVAVAPVVAIADAGAVGYAAVDLVAAFCGICSVVLCAKGKRSGFLFGLVNVAGYAFISYHNQYYGEVMLNVLFYVPSNIAAYILWTRHKDNERGGKEVKAKALRAWQLAASCAVVAAATVAYHFVLEALGGAMTMLDGASTVLSVFATALMVLRYSEQWFFWIVVDVITVALWCFAGDPVMIAMWAAYLVNAVYGYLMWLNKCGRRVPLKRALDLAARS